MRHDNMCVNCGRPAQSGSMFCCDGCRAEYEQTRGDAMRVTYPARMRVQLK